MWPGLGAPKSSLRFGRSSWSLSFAHHRSGSQMAQMSVFLMGIVVTISLSDPKPPSAALSVLFPSARSCPEAAVPNHLGELVKKLPISIQL